MGCSRCQLLEAEKDALNQVLKAIVLESGGKFRLDRRAIDAVSARDRLKFWHDEPNRCMVYRLIRAEDKGVAEAVELLKAKGYKVEKA